LSRISHWSLVPFFSLFAPVGSLQTSFQVYIWTKFFTCDSLCFRLASCCLVACLAYSVILQIEVVCSSEINFYPTIWHHIPEDSTLKDPISNISYIYTFHTLRTHSFWNPTL
jgi:hypothetical protein